MKFTKLVEIGGNLTAIQTDGTTRRHVLWFGDSTRDKPTMADGAKDSDSLYESDTRKAYVFNGKTESWDEV